MANALPFALDAVTPQMRALLTALNDPTFLLRTVAVPLDDNTVDGRSYYGLVSSKTLGGNNSEYVANSNNSTATVNAVLSVNTLRAVPFIHSNGFRISAFGFSVTTGGAAGSVGRAGIYDCNDDLRGDCYPKRLLYETGEISTTSTGRKNTTPNLDLEEGRMYWAVYLCGVAAPTVSAVPVAGVDVLLGASSGVGSTRETHISVAYTYAALPQTFPTTAVVQTSQPPALFYTYTQVSSPRRTLTIPLFSPRYAGFSLRGVRVSRGATLTAADGAGIPYTVAYAKVRGTAGDHTIGTYDSRKNRLTPGSPFDMTGGDIERPLAKGEEVVMVIEQSGWPKVSLLGGTAFVDYVYTGSN